MAQQLLRITDVMARTTMKKSTIYLRMKQGAFPKPIPLGSSHGVAWLDEEVDAWIAEQVRVARG